MEGCPRTLMISYDTKEAGPVDFTEALSSIGLDNVVTDLEKCAIVSPTTKYIREYYQENADNYTSEISQLNQMRKSLATVARGNQGCSLLRKYYTQLFFLQSRFPMGEGGASAVLFTWCDVYSGEPVAFKDILYEQACVLFNLGGLYSQLGSNELRSTEESMKVACTYFQCSAGAFKHLRENYSLDSLSDMGKDILKLKEVVMLGQAQECLLEKSIKDNKKNVLIARISIQVKEYFDEAVKLLSSNDTQEMGSSVRKSWSKHLQIKILVYTAIAYMYMSNESHDGERYGEEVGYLKVAGEKMTEALKLSKGQPEQVMETTKFIMDVAGNKLQGAVKDNDFVYHQSVPTPEKLPEIKGASLVKAMPFSHNDPNIQDIFERLIPMRAHEAASLYSEEKAKLLRCMSTEIEDKNVSLNEALSSMHIEELANPEEEKLPDNLAFKLRTFQAEGTGLNKMDESITELNEFSSKLKLLMDNIGEQLDDEKDENSENKSDEMEKHWRDLKQCREAHDKADKTNSEILKHFESHRPILEFLLRPPAEILASLPSQNVVEAPTDEPVVQRIRELLGAVEKMKSQRVQFIAQLRDQLNKDDITKDLVVREDGNTESFFQEQLQKHDDQCAVIRQNLSAQENILGALTEANAKYASTREAAQEVSLQRTSKVQSYIASLTLYEEMIERMRQGMQFYKNLELTLAKLAKRVDMCLSENKKERKESQQPKSTQSTKGPPARPTAAKPVFTVDRTTPSITSHVSVNKTLLQGPQDQTRIPFDTDSSGHSQQPSFTNTGVSLQNVPQTSMPRQGIPPHSIEQPGIPHQRVPPSFPSLDQSPLPGFSHGGTTHSGNLPRQGAPTNLPQRQHSQDAQPQLRFQHDQFRRPTGQETRQDIPQPMLHQQVLFNTTMPQQGPFQQSLHQPALPQQGLPRQDLPQHVPPGHGLRQQGLPQQTFPQQGLPQQGLPQQGIPRQGMPQQGLPQQSFARPVVPQQGIPQHGLPRHNMPQQGLPQQGLPQQGLPQQGLPQQRLPQQGLSQQGFPQQGLPQPMLQQQGLRQHGLARPIIPQQGMPQQGVPQQGVPQQGVPQQGVPQQGVPQQGVPQQGVPQQGVPQQGVPQPGVPQPGLPQPSIPQQRILQQGLGHQGLPRQSLPTQGLPEQRFSAQGLFPQSHGQQGPLQGSPQQALPRYGIPQQGVPQVNVQQQGLQPQGPFQQSAIRQGVPQQGIPHQNLPRQFPPQHLFSQRGVSPLELPQHVLPPPLEPLPSDCPTGQKPLPPNVTAGRPSMTPAQVPRSVQTVPALPLTTTSVPRSPFDESLSREQQYYQLLTDQKDPHQMSGTPANSNNPPFPQSFMRRTSSDTPEAGGPQMHEPDFRSTQPLFQSRGPGLLMMRGDSGSMSGVLQRSLPPQQGQLPEMAVSTDGRGTIQAQRSESQDLHNISGLRGINSAPRPNFQGLPLQGDDYKFPTNPTFQNEQGQHPTIGPGSPTKPYERSMSNTLKETRQVFSNEVRRLSDGQQQQPRQYHTTEQGRYLNTDDVNLSSNGQEQHFSSSHQRWSRTSMSNETGPSGKQDFTMHSQLQRPLEQSEGLQIRNDRFDISSSNRVPITGYSNIDPLLSQTVPVSVTSKQLPTAMQSYYRPDLLEQQTSMKREVQHKSLPVESSGIVPMEPSREERGIDSRGYRGPAYDKSAKVQENVLSFEGQNTRIPTTETARMVSVSHTQANWTPSPVSTTISSPSFSPSYQQPFGLRGQSPKPEFPQIPDRNLRAPPTAPLGPGPPPDAPSTSYYEIRSPIPGPRFQSQLSLLANQAYNPITLSTGPLMSASLDPVVSAILGQSRQLNNQQPVSNMGVSNASQDMSQYNLQQIQFQQVLLQQQQLISLLQTQQTQQTQQMSNETHQIEKLQAQISDQQQLILKLMDNQHSNAPPESTVATLTSREGDSFARTPSINSVTTTEHEYSSKGACSVVTSESGKTLDYEQCSHNIDEQPRSINTAEGGKEQCNQSALDDNDSRPRTSSKALKAEILASFETLDFIVQGNQETKIAPANEAKGPGTSTDETSAGMSRVTGPSMVHDVPFYEPMLDKEHNDRLKNSIVHSTSALQPHVGGETDTIKLIENEPPSVESLPDVTETTSKSAKDVSKLKEVEKTDIGAENKDLGAEPFKPEESLGEVDSTVVTASAVSQPTKQDQLRVVSPSITLANTEEEASTPPFNRQFGRESFYIPDDKNVGWLKYLEDLDKSVENLHTSCMELCKKMPGTNVDGFIQMWNDLGQVEDLDASSYTCEAGKININKNRYRDILPWDHARVKLQRLDNDYINASHIENLTQFSPSYIATQGPIPQCFEEFWTMVWEQECTVIAMLTSEVEGSKLKCHPYWPRELDVFVDYGKMSVCVTKQELYPQWKNRIMLLTDTESNETRIIRHLQFTAWPDYGVPATPYDILAFVEEVYRACLKGDSKLKAPIITHCSAGVGRTGTFCCIYSAVAEINGGNGLIDIPGVVRKLRQCRSHMVQRKEQLIFSYQAILCYAQQFLVGEQLKREKEAKCTPENDDAFQTVDEPKLKELERSEQPGSVLQSEAKEEVKVSKDTGDQEYNDEFITFPKVVVSSEDNLDNGKSKVDDNGLTEGQDKDGTVEDDCPTSPIKSLEDNTENDLKTDKLLPGEDDIVDSKDQSPSDEVEAKSLLIDIDSIGPRMEKNDVDEASDGEEIETEGLTGDREGSSASGDLLGSLDENVNSDNTELLTGVPSSQLNVDVSALNPAANELNSTELERAESHPKFKISSGIFTTAKSPPVSPTQTPKFDSLIIDGSHDVSNANMSLSGDTNTPPQSESKQEDFDNTE